MKKQGIETIFSSLDDYSTPPPPELWDAIEAQLDAPKRKKRALFWWPVAASLVIGLSLGGLFLISDLKTDIQSPAIDIQNKIVIEEPNIKPEKVPSAEKSISSSKYNANAKGTLQQNSVIQTKISVHTPSNTTSINSNSGLAHFVTNSPVHSSYQNSNSVLFSKDKTLQKESIAVVENTHYPIAAQSETTSETLLNTSEKQNEIAQELQQLEQTLAHQETKTEEPKTKSSSSNKWSLGVYAGVTDSENLSNKKVLGTSVSSKQGTTYGIKTNYKLNKKWGVSAGLKINELGQSIANVSYYNKQVNVMNNMATNDFFKVTHDATYLSSNPNYVFASATNTEAKNTTTATATIDQNLQYLEIPLEISYSVLDSKKANIRFNTGGFMGKLISNEVSLDGNAIGETLHVNEYVFGSKLSSTLQYEVLKKTNVFVEPGMNYYLNPMKDNSFNQFQWGLNFGINVNF
ncbi:outer membrane beta-barrel protein [Flavobacterium agrisoli]|uniref:Outer membrane beta-barrel protein n=1 Tax=Flavobacterium agrisoli TaxID=2793066 RepID=A0A934PN08_9FLAO|nr:outer membrane beta-barrel protein [Flavobacterium agrisoli]MBK0371217.1 outer membrane beta-barrel protein [Flavobacterium agrisoli]